MKLVTHTHTELYYYIRRGIYRISGSAWCFLAVGTAFWLYLPRLFTNNSENCETPFPCQTLSSCLQLVTHTHTHTELYYVTLVLHVAPSGEVTANSTKILI